jgi:hypothetical protein
LGTDLIIASGDGVIAAEAFGHATGRPVLRVRNAAEIVNVIAAPSAPRTITIAGGSTLTTSDVERTMRASAAQDVPVGFLPGWFGAEAASRWVEKIVSHQWSRPASSLLWSAFGRLAPLQGRTSTVTVLPTDALDLSERLRERYTILAIATHGNGVDAPLGRAVLCSLAADSTVTHGPFLPCGSGGPCLRDRPDSRGELDRIDPAGISSDILIWATCWGVLCADAIFDPSRSLAARFIESPECAALLTSYRDIRPDDAHLVLASALAHAGTPLGAIVLALNATSDCRTEVPWILLGDPAAALDATGPRSAPTIAAGAPPAPANIGPGYFRLELADNTAMVFAGPVDGEALGPSNLWLRPVPGSGSAAGLLLSEQPRTITFEGYRHHLDVTAGRVLAAIWGSSDDLRFARSFIELAGASSDDGAGMKEMLDKRLQSNAAALSLRDREAALSGPHAPLQALAEREVTNWSALNRRIHDSLHTFLTGIAGVLHHTYWRFPPRRESIESGARCPTCQAPTHRDRLVFVEPPGERAMQRCARCGVVADTPVWIESVAVSGPDEIVVGRRTTFVVSLHLNASVPWLLARVALGLQPVPWRVDVDSPAVEVIVDPDGGHDMEVAATIRVDGCPPTGRYFLVAAMVINGALVLGRRPVQVTS